MNDNDDLHLGELLGNAQGLSLHLFNALSEALVGAGVVEASAISEALDRQATVAIAEDNVRLLRMMAATWRGEEAT